MNSRLWRYLVAVALLSLVFGRFPSLGTIGLGAQIPLRHVVFELGDVGTPLELDPDDGIAFPQPVAIVAIPPPGFHIPPIPASKTPGAGICAIGDNGAPDCTRRVQMVFPKGATNIRFDVVGGYGGNDPFTNNHCRSFGSINGADALVTYAGMPSGFLGPGFDPVELFLVWTRQVGPLTLPLNFIHDVTVDGSQRTRFCGLGVDDAGNFAGGIALANIEYDIEALQPSSSPLEVVDPACATVTSCHGAFINGTGTGVVADTPSDLAALASAPVHRTGAVVDGVTRLLLRMRSDSEVTFSLSTVPSLWNEGYLTTIDEEQGLFPSQLAVAPVTVNGSKWVFAVYHVPPDLQQGNIGVHNAVVKITASDAQAASTTADVALILPPPLLVHGVWSGKDAWEGFEQFLRTQGYPVCPECLVEYGIYDGGATSFNPAGFSRSIHALERTRQEVLANLRNRGFAATRLDVVAHSMGALVARARVAQGTYILKENYNQGHFRKIISVGTPHQGSELADWMVANKCESTTLRVPVNVGPGLRTTVSTRVTLEEFMAFPWRKPLYQGVYDLQTNSDAIDRLGSTNVPAYAVIGISPDFTPDARHLVAQEFGLNLLPQLFGFDDTIDELFHNLQNDNIVNVISQRGGLRATATVEVFGVTHSPPTTPGVLNETASPDVWQKVLRALLAPLDQSDSDITFDQFKKNERKGTPRTLQPCPPAGSGLSAEGGSSSAHLVAQSDETTPMIELLPAPGTTARPGETIQVQLTIEGGQSLERSVAFINQQVQVVEGSGPYAFSYQVPTDRAGRIDIKVLAAGAQNYLASTFVTVVPADAANFVDVFPTTLTFSQIGERRQLNITGSYLSGPLNISSVTAGSSYATASGSTAVVSVDDGGVVEARGAGQDTIVVTNGGMTAQVSVTVAITNTPPLLAPLNDLSLSPGSITTVPLSATDPDGDALRLYAGNLPAFATLTDFGNGTGQLELRPETTDAGGYAPFVSAVDDGEPLEAAYAAFTLTVGPPAVMSVSRSAVRFSATKGASSSVLSSVTPAQSVTVSFGGKPIAWTATSNLPWLQVTGGAGSGTGSFSLAVVDPTNVLKPDTILVGSVFLTAANASPANFAIEVSLAVSRPGETKEPFGAFDTPANGATGLIGSIPVTGWALDDVGIQQVQIWRNCVETIDRPVGACAAAAPGGAPNFVFIANAAFLSGARPDVETLNPTTPVAYRAGWGYLMATNALPHLTNGTAPGGQGTFTLLAYAVDVENHFTLLGTKTITLDNDHATIPFGAIDTPDQGGTVTTNVYANFGWAMTQINKCIETANTASYRVYIDGVVRPITPGVNWFPGLNRSDIAAAYPGYCNATNALAAYYIDLDALGLANGLHTIGWDIIDDQGNVAGVGSRFFIVTR